jgi:phytoene dehydrogenase-like protein
MDNSMIIIGGGLSGLAAGCYGQMNGYRTSIFEMHNKAGGLCTGWTRKGYTIDGALHWVMGTKPGTSVYKLWQELGAAQHWQVVNHDRFFQYEDGNGRIFSLDTDIDRLEQQMMEFAPEDESTIREFIEAIKKSTNIDLPIGKPPELYGILDYLKMFKMLPYMMFMRKWGKISQEDYAKRIKNPFLRKILSSLSPEGELADSPALTIPMTVSFLNQKNGGYIIGGGLALVSYIQQRYLDLGGELYFKKRVDKILVENDKAVGVRLTDGTEHYGDIVISAADGRATIFDMLEGKYIDDRIRSYYDNLGLYPPLVYVGLGVDRKFDDVPSSTIGLSFTLEKPITIAGMEQKTLRTLICNFDPTMAPEGKTVVKVQINTDYDYWERLYEDPERYKSEKEQIAETVVTLLDKRFPGLADQVEMRDVATPMTWIRYTGNWRGSYQGWKYTPNTFMMRMSKTLPGLDNFYMAGQWVNPGGSMPGAVMSGRQTIQIICNKYKKPFTTSTS